MESVVSVHPLENFHLELRFNTGETRLFDARPYLNKGVFRRLQDKELFNQAYVAFDTVCWPGTWTSRPKRSTTNPCHSPRSPSGAFFMIALSQSPVLE